MACASCGAPLAARWCAACGEKRLEPGDLSLRHFLAQFGEALTNVESRLWRSLRRLLTRPGLLAADHVRGARRGHVHPLRLFLLCNLAYFLLQPFTPYNTFHTGLRTHMAGLSYSGWAARVVERRTAETGEELDTLRLRFDASARTTSKVLLIALAPALAAVLALLHRRRGWVEHLVLALEFLSFLLLYVCLALPFLMLLAWWGLRPLGLDASVLMRELPSTLQFAGASALWLAVAQRRFYGTSRAASALRSLAAVGGLALAVQAYRLLLFVLVLWRLPSE